MGKKQLHVYVSGLVQGVFFRAGIRDEALRLSLNGWVRNLSDGRVEALFEGDEKSLEAILRWCSQGPPGSRPEEVESEWGDFSGKLRGFQIRYR